MATDPPTSDNTAQQDHISNSAAHLACWRCGAPGRYICDECLHVVMIAPTRDPEDEYEVDWP